MFEISPCPPTSHPLLVRPSLHCTQHCISTRLREFSLGCQMKKALVSHFSLSLQSYHSYNDLPHHICTWIFRRIYVVHDEVKDKNFELELSWIGEGILYDFIVAILMAHFWMTASTVRFQLCKSEELVPMMRGRNTDEAPQTLIHFIASNLWYLGQIGTIVTQSVRATSLTVYLCTFFFNQDIVSANQNKGEFQEEPMRSSD